MKDHVTIDIPTATVIQALKRELGAAAILFLLASGHTPDALESQILLDAGKKLLELEKTKNAELPLIKKIGDSTRFLTSRLDFHLLLPGRPPLVWSLSVGFPAVQPF